MIYVNGDGIAAASYAACPYSCAGDDASYTLYGVSPHPKNLEASFAKFLSNVFHQQLTVNAHETSCHAKIFRQTMEAIENSHKIRYVVIAWPDFYRGEIWSHGNDVQFNFGQRSDFVGNIFHGEAVQQYIKNFTIQAAHAEFNRMLEDLCSFMDERKIQHAMVMSNNQVDAKSGNWVMDPKTDNVMKWAQPLGLLNSSGYLNPKGHIELAKLIIPLLTNQL